MQLTGLSLLRHTKIPSIPLDFHLDLLMLKLLLAHSLFYMSCLNQLGLTKRKAYQEVCVFLQGNRSVTECHRIAGVCSLHVTACPLPLLIS